MNLITRITIAFLFLPFCGISQEKSSELVYFLGGSIKHATIAEQPGYILPFADIAIAPYIQMTYKDFDYAVTSYTVSILSRRLGKVVGQLKQQQGNLLESAAKMDYTLSSGDRIFIDDLNAFCGKCTEQKNITTKGLAILIE